MAKGKSRGPAKLPAKQLAILAIARFAEPVALTSVFPYLPEMIESFGVKKKDVAIWAGVTSTVFSLSQSYYGVCLQVYQWLLLCGPLLAYATEMETLETKKHKKDIGRELGKRLVFTFKTIFCLHPKAKSFHRASRFGPDENTSLLRPRTYSIGSESSRSFDETFASKHSKPVQPRPTLKEVFTRQSVINLMAYTFLALHAVAYDQLLPVFMHTPPQVPDETNTRLPFKFSGGFGLGPGRIGTLFTMYGVLGCFIQFLIFPPVARRFGVLNCFKCCAVTFPLVYFATPFPALIQDPIHQQVAIFGIMIVKCFAVIFAFPCSIILLTNSAVSLRVLGTLNGVAVSISAIGRAIGPALTGAAFSWGLGTGYMITSYWLLSFLAVIGAIPIWHLVEMEGFSRSDSDSESSDEEEVDGEPSMGQILEGDEVLTFEDDEEALDVVDGPSLARRRKSKGDDEGENNGLQKRRMSREMKRRMSSPIGLREPVGPGGGRRLSNGLAASNCGQGTGGTSFA
ncbi:hypothetical protein G7Y89_g6324 [Cudoniella acicularis]|uniref:Major facilitator superfamily (MFS) profile domain-containing protein n=1 Tax=Cudoniella acicularis TaxID=354080 RepID=A0A8H4RM63_9HELO|nr:hypothetical protein G7Y89_g6324 [Cudoniella acicularis]